MKQASTAVFLFGLVAAGPAAARAKLPSLLSGRGGVHLATRGGAQTLGSTSTSTAIGSVLDEQKEEVDGEAADAIAAVVAAGASAVAPVADVDMGDLLAQEEGDTAQAEAAKRGELAPVESVCLEWEKVSCSVGSKKVLSNVSGKAEPGRLLAIIGPSGSGKTTLLNSLCGQVPKTANMVLSGNLSVNGEKRKDGQKQAYVQQSDVFYSQMTVRETLEMAARLRLPRHMSLADKKAYVNALLATLGLGKCADTIVGDEKVRGVSGGERKRLSLACQLFGSPSMIFADEPTSGLDSFQAERVVATLKDLAEKGGHTIVISIHQPKGSIYSMFDDLLVLSEGKVLYVGEADKAGEYFTTAASKISKEADKLAKETSKAGSIKEWAGEYLSSAATKVGLKGPPPVPKDHNTAEYIIDLVSTDTSSPEAEEVSKERVAKLQDAWTAVEEQAAADLKAAEEAAAAAEAATVEAAARAAAAVAAAKEAGEVVEVEEAEAVAKEEESIVEVMSRAMRRHRKRAARRHRIRMRKRARTGGLGVQFRLLLTRSWRQVTRAKSANIARLITNVGSAVVFGCIYWRMGTGQSSINDRIGLMQVSAINTAMSVVVKTLNTFPVERSIVQRERAAGAYKVGPYLVSKLIAELPTSAIFPNLFGLVLYKMVGLNPDKNRYMNFCSLVTLTAFTSSALGMLVGAFTPNEDAALAVGPALMTVAIIFSGFYINPENIPAAFRWLKQSSVIKWSFEALAVNELRGLQFSTDDKQTRGPPIDNGDQMLERIGFGDSTVEGATKGLAAILGSCYALTYMFLLADVPRFQKMQELEPTPALGQEEGEGVVAEVGEGNTVLQIESDLSGFSDSVVETAVEEP